MNVNLVVVNSVNGVEESRRVFKSNKTVEEYRNDSNGYIQDLFETSDNKEEK